MLHCSSPHSPVTYAHSLAMLAKQLTEAEVEHFVAARASLVAEFTDCSGERITVADAKTVAQGCMGFA